VSELTLFVFRIAFLVLLWVFVFFVVYAVRSDLFGQRAKRLPAAPRAAAPDASAFLTQAHGVITDGVVVAPGAARQGLALVITAGPKKGERIPLVAESVTIGRASDSSLVIRDDYTSTRHAVFELRRGAWQITDLGSTNGTLVNGSRISSPVTVVPGTSITVGQTVFDVRADS
jgi:pSer/pThr/pTyr-binding forkhead associated (FHA) protein